MIDKDTFCYVPFKELYFEELYGGNVRSCCIQDIKEEIDSCDIFTNDPNRWFRVGSKHIKRLRKEFLNGKKPKECYRCWKLEDNNEVSYRQKWNKRYINQDKHTTLQVIDIRLSNKCNLQCKMCGPHFSDQIGKNVKKAEKDTDYKSEFYITDFRPTDNKLLSDLKTSLPKNKTIKRIKLGGGEPMIMDEVEDFLHALVEKGRTDLDIFILSNCTTIKTSIIDILTKFDNVEISCSIDGVGNWIEYQRFPASWKSIDRNFRRLQKSRINATLTPCFSMLNILGLADYIEWVNSLDTVAQVAFNEVHFPSCLHWSVVPIEYRKDLNDRLKNLSFTLPRSKDLFSNIKHRLKTEYRPLTDVEKGELRNKILLWDYNNKIKFKDFVPFYSELNL